MSLPLNKILCGNSVEKLKLMSDSSVDLTVTSPLLSLHQNLLESGTVSSKMEN